MQRLVGSEFIRFECYFSLERKVTKSSRLNRLHCFGERLHSKIRNSLRSNNGFSLPFRLSPTRTFTRLGLSKKAVLPPRMAETDTYII